MHPATLVRHRLADAAQRLGPDAPTLCHPWAVRDLVAHLVVRETRPDVLPGIAQTQGALRRHSAAVQAEVAAQDFATTVRRFRDGPPLWWPLRIGVLDDMVNTAEFAIHLEDMLRARTWWEPTEHAPEVERALWRSYRQSAPLFFRTAPVGVVAMAPGHGRTALRRPRPTTGSVVVRGTPLELLLHAFGRTSVARVEVEGSDADVAALAGHERAA